VSALGHGIFAGTDAGVGWVFFLYLGSAAAVAFMLAYRMLIPAPPAREHQALIAPGSIDAYNQP
jgi:hypothetical protein